MVYYPPQTPVYPPQRQNPGMSSYPPGMSQPPPYMPASQPPAYTEKDEYANAQPPRGPPPPQQPAAASTRPPAAPSAPPAPPPPPPYNNATQYHPVVYQREQYLPHINDYLCLNIMSMCCCWPLSIYGILKSLEARHALRIGDRATADANARTAKNVGLLSVIIGFVFLTACVILIVLFSVKDLGII